ncbi:MAG: site-2 protease family protein [Myxococcota bacterium]|nr:site-2 protease family protein [Myxococcota bacterium]
MEQVLDQIFGIATFIVPMLLSLTVHEYSHARVAYALGDDTASMQGRLTLNPLAHADPIGTFLMPVVARLGGGLPLIGWAKPVPVSPHRFDRRVTMHTGMLLTAVAGPLSNLVLMFLAAAGMKIVFEVSPEAFLPPEEGVRMTAMQTGARLLVILAFMNAGLAVFNLLPLPPLDGSRMLPRRMQQFVAPIQSFSYLILMAIVMFASPVIRVPVAFLVKGALWATGFPTGGL